MSERFSGAVLEMYSAKPQVETHNKARIEDLFENLPVAQGVDLKNFSALVSNEDPTELREKIVNRYLDLSILRRNLGIPGNLEINNDVAIAVLDDKVFSEAVEMIKEEGNLFETAVHEIGHSAAAENIGWKTGVVTIVRGPGYLGLTSTSPKGEPSFENWAFGRAVIAYGGATAVQMLGYEARGIGSDMAHAQALARIVIQSPNSRYSTEHAFLADAERIAHAALSTHGTTGISKMAQELLHRKTIT